MLEGLTTIAQNFEMNVSSVYELMDFDRVVLDYSISSVRDLSNKLKVHHKLGNPHLTAETILTH